MSPYLVLYIDSYIITIWLVQCSFLFLHALFIPNNHFL